MADGSTVVQVLLPVTLEELWSILAAVPGAALYAGGTDLLVKKRAGLVDSPCLVCLERIDALQGVRDNGEALFIAAAFTHGRILEHPSVRTEFPVLAQALRVLGSPPIRHMGTIGGNIVTASPAGDTLPALYALDAEVEIRSRDHSRRLPIGDFIRGPGSVALNTGEILAGVWLRKAPHWNIQHYEKVGRRKAQACAVASMAALVQLTDAGRIERIRLAWGSVGPFVITAPDVEAALTGRVLSLESLESVRGMVEHVVAPIDDLRASAEYRRSVAGALLLRLLSSPAGPGGTAGLSSSGGLEN